MLTRRRFVQTVGIGAAGAITGSWIGARGREGSLFSVLDAQTAAPANDKCAGTYLGDAELVGGQELVPDAVAC